MLPGATPLLHYIGISRIQQVFELLRMRQYVVPVSSSFIQFLWSNKAPNGGPRGPRVPRGWLWGWNLQEKLGEVRDPCQNLRVLRGQIMVICGQNNAINIINHSQYHHKWMVNDGNMDGISHQTWGCFILLRFTHITSRKVAVNQQQKKIVSEWLCVQNSAPILWNW